MNQEEHLAILNTWKMNISSFMQCLMDYGTPSQYHGQTWTALLSARVLCGDLIGLLNKTSIYPIGNDPDTPEIEPSKNQEDHMPFNYRVVDDKLIMGIKQLKKEIKVFAFEVLNTSKKQGELYNIIEQQIGVQLLLAKNYLGMVLNDIYRFKNSTSLKESDKNPYDLSETVKNIENMTSIMNEDKPDLSIGDDLEANDITPKDIIAKKHHFKVNVDKKIKR